MAEKKTTECETAGVEEQDTRRCRQVEEAICRRAKGYKVKLNKTFKVKRVEYDPDTGKKTLEKEELETGFEEVHVPADLRAGAYWLNNRDPARWLEHPRPTDEGEAAYVEIPPEQTVALPLDEGGN